MNLRTVKWVQWDKTQSRELLGLFICVCVALCTVIAQNIAQNRPDNFPSYPPDNHKSQQKLIISYSQRTESTTENQPAQTEYMPSLTFCVRRYAVIATKPVHRLQIHPIARDRHTDVHDQYAFRLGYASRKMYQQQMSHGSHETRCWPITSIFSFLVLNGNCLQ